MFIANLRAQGEYDEDMRYAYNAEWEDPVSGTKTAFTLLHWSRASEVKLVSRRPN